MIKYKDAEKKINLPKRSITISNVKVVENELMDEEGCIIERLKDILPDGENTIFSFKITVELPTEESTEEDED